MRGGNNPDTYLSCNKKPYNVEGWANKIMAYYTTLDNGIIIQIILHIKLCHDIHSQLKRKDKRQGCKNTANFLTPRCCR